MDYLYLGTYQKGSRVETATNGILVETPSAIKHFADIPFGIRHHTSGNTLCFGEHSIALKTGFRDIFINERYVFVSYGDRLEVMHYDGAVVKLFLGHGILYACGLFLVNEKTAFVVDGDANTVFTKPQTEVVGFADNGDILHLKRGCSPPGKQEEAACHSKAPQAYPPERFLSIESFRSQQAYNTETVPIFEMDDISVYKGSTAIQNVTCVSHFYGTEIVSKNTSKKLLCHVVLCPGSVFLIARELVARKRLAVPFSHIAAGRFAVHNFLQEGSFYELVLVLGMFVGVRLCDADRIEDFLCKLILHRKRIEPFVGTLVRNIEFSNFECTRLARANKNAPDAKTGPRAPSAGSEHQSQQYISYRSQPHKRLCTADTIVCRAYRRVDDRGKETLEPYIAVLRLSPDDLYYIIIYKLHHLDHFIKLCIANKRLFYLQELVCFYEKIGRADELRAAFLRNGLFIFHYGGLEKITAVEKEEIDAQRQAFHFA